MKDLVYTITDLEVDGPSLNVSVTWETVDGEAREQVLLDVLAVPADATPERVEAAIRGRAETYVGPKFVDPRPSPRAELAALIGQEKKIERAAARGGAP